MVDRMRMALPGWSIVPTYITVFVIMATLFAIKGMLVKSPEGRHR